MRDRWSIDVPGGADLSTQGNIVNHEYRIEQGGRPVATVSKRWFRIRDTYGIEVLEPESDALILAAAICIDEMARA